MTEEIFSTRSSDAVIFEKVKVYNSIIGIFVDMINAGKGIKPGVVNALGKKLSMSGIQLFILAPDTVVTAYLKWRTMANINEDPEQVIKAYAEMLLSMRRDIEPDTKCDVETAMDLWG